MKKTTTKHFNLTSSRSKILRHLLHTAEAPTYFDMRNLIRGDLRGIIRSLINAGMVSSFVNRRDVFYRLTYRGYLLAQAIDPKTLALKPGEDIPDSTDITDECRYNWRNLWVFQIIGSGARIARDNVKPITGESRDSTIIAQKSDQETKAA